MHHLNSCIKTAVLAAGWLIHLGFYAIYYLQQVDSAYFCKPNGIRLIIYAYLYHINPGFDRAGDTIIRLFDCTVIHQC